MLRRLFLRDYVIVDRLELEFSAGFGALTGETGAGKSILVDALSLALGERADAGVVRSGAARAEVGAEFEVAADSPLAAWLAANDFDASECLLRRVIEAEGRSRAYINGAPATLGQLKEAAEFLADIHGQHAHHSLLRADAQRQLLDAHAGLTPLAREVGVAYREWQRLHELRSRAEQDAAASAHERGLLEWQIKELHDLDFHPERWRENNQEQRRLAHAAALLAGAQAAVDALDGGELPVAVQLDALLASLRNLAEIDAGLREPLSLIESAAIQLGEAGHSLARYADRLELDPQRLAELEQGMENVTALARKHRVAAEELPATLERLRARFDELRLTGDPAALAEREAAAQAQFQALALRLSEGRQGAARELGQAVSALMQDLALAGGRFEIQLTPLPQGAACGLESVEFLVAANQGQPLRPLAKVASGGELSRIGLAIQVIASSAGEVPTLIFDEVDVGIGGRVAEIVGRMLKGLGSARQVLCVTHLPQVAAQAGWQWSIAKENVGREVRSAVKELDANARIEEIARMLGGVDITDTTRRHAAEMLGFSAEA